MIVDHEALVHKGVPIHQFSGMSPRHLATLSLSICVEQTHHRVIEVFFIASIVIDNKAFTQLQLHALFYQG
jgi:hypothetical protein